MPESPVRKKVVNKYWEDDEAAFMAYLQRHLIKKDTEFDDPTTIAAPRQHEGQLHLAVTTTCTKYKYEDASSDTENIARRFITLVGQARAAGGFVAPKDQNGVARNGAEQAYYKNRALEALALELTTTYNTAHGTSFVFSDFVCRGFVCELACF